MKWYMLKNEFIRYIINGLVATAAHYCTLNVNVLLFKFESIGAANLLAACVGITVSFIGSRYFVYKEYTNSLVSQLTRFSMLYMSIALLHGSFLYLWSDIYHMNYNVGFLIATVFQVLLSYFGNKKLVFKNAL
ncbi:GtrA family protein [Vibrio cholerae]|nr:GtrA family protein [Vibrio cholerae]EGR2520216.1 GtrA family protein [Vibrio cholerae]TXZ49528.1 GtrA family protein [Vibrio cholerae]